jgi:hypothetical protein
VVLWITPLGKVQWLDTNPVVRLVTGGHPETLKPGALRPGLMVRSPLLDRPNGLERGEGNRRQTAPFEAFCSSREHEKPPPGGLVEEGGDGDFGSLSDT